MGRSWFLVAAAMGSIGLAGIQAAVPPLPNYDAAKEYRIGQAALNAGDFGTAKTAFDHIVLVAPKDANAHYLAGISRVKLGDFKGATSLLERAVKLDKGMTSAWAELGMAYARAGNKAKAKGTLSTLQARASICGKCSDAGTLRTAIEGIEAALAPPR